MKRKLILPMLMAGCMTVSTIPANVMAAEAFSDDAVVWTEEAAPEISAEEEEPVFDSAEPALTDFGAGEVEVAFSDEETDAETPVKGEKPADGTTEGQPFAKGTAGSENFRIPGIVTLKDGTLVAACDARWNTTGDGGGLDTIVSRSTDGGKTWNYTIANYLGDNGNTWNGGSTAFIDPAIATDGTNVYMVADLFPAGYALNSANQQPPKTGGDGFNADGTLRLSANNRESYDFYLKDGQIYDSENQAVEGYTVDGLFNIKGENCDTNLFLADSPYQVFPTDYLYLTKSADGGATWSDPTLINVKKTEEQTYLIGPGNGIVTSDGTIMFTGYEFTSGTQNSSIIYSKDGGKTWGRTAHVSEATKDGENYAGWSSEAQLVELENGTIRMFFRNGFSGGRGKNILYADAVKDGDGYRWTTYDSGPAFYANTQISALAYSKKVEGKQVILVSCPTNSEATGNPTGRSIGKIYAGLVKKDGSMKWTSAYQVTDGPYAYSCMAELKDGSIGLLYEAGEASGIVYKNIAESEVLPPREVVTDSKKVKVGEEEALAETLKPEDAADDVVWSVSDKKVVKVNAEGKAKAVGVGKATVTAKIADVVIGKYEFTVGLAEVKPCKAVSAGYDKVKLTWNKVPGAKEYVVYQKDGDSWKKAGKTAETSFVKTGLTCGKSYTFRVRAYAEYKDVTYKSGYDKDGTACKPSLAKVKVESAKAVKTGVKTTWKKVSGATSYAVCRRTGEGEWKKIATVKAAKTSYTDTTAKKGVKYFYTVRAIRKEGAKYVYGSYDTTGNSAVRK